VTSAVFARIKAATSRGPVYRGRFGQCSYELPSKVAPYFYFPLALVLHLRWALFGLLLYSKSFFFFYCFNKVIFPVAFCKFVVCDLCFVIFLFLFLDYSLVFP